MKRLLLIGGGGHCRSCIDVIQQARTHEIVGILDVEEKVGQQIDGIEIIGTDDQLEKWLLQVDEVLITLGRIGKSDRRKNRYEMAMDKGAEFATVVSPRAYVSDNAKVAKGVIVMHDACVNAGAEVGENCIINTKALIEHDARIGAHSHISTRSTLNGGVVVGENVFIGSHAMVFNDCTVGDHCVVGGGQIVGQDLPDNGRLI